jgi:16S rRNA (guanine1207-N2)-methyltransferase
MNDGAYDYLIAQLANTPGFKIWFAEERCGAYLPQLAAFADQLLVLTHRVDIYQQACALNIPAQLNDATWPQLFATQNISACFIRIAKEKPWVHHLINQARQYLPINGALFLAGHKQEGIKTYADKAAKLFNCHQKAQKNGEFYAQALQQSALAAGELLPCESYPEFRLVLTLNEKPIVSKPGIYGWDKIDQGSQLLVDSLREEKFQGVKSSLDLGCGYGYLTLATAHLPLGLRTCTDNNSAAVRACELNCQAWSIPAVVHLADCAEGIQKTFDVILCNPPFHQGFNVESQLTKRFLAAAAKHLAVDGLAYFVVNQFIPLERIAVDYFKHCETINHNGQFKILRLSRPRH